MPVDPPERHEEFPGQPTMADLGEHFERVRPRLERMLAVRLDPRVRRRVEPADILQEAYLEAARGLSEYLEQRPLPFFLWLRRITGLKLAEFHRKHLGAARRDAGREITPGGIPAASTASMAGYFVDPSRSPAQSAARLEILEKVENALRELEELDREVLAMRYFEELSNEETATALGLTPSGATKRHVRALRRLRSVLPQARDAPTP